MAVRVRLTRVGGKKNPIWRVVVADGRSPRDGRFIETIGHYNAQTEPSTIVIDEDRYRHWVARGAQPSGTVKQLVRAQSSSAAAGSSTQADDGVFTPDGGDSPPEEGVSTPDGDSTPAQAGDTAS